MRPRLTLDPRGTAYFATWASFLLSGLIMHSEFSQFRSIISSVSHFDYSSRYAFYLLLASLVEIISGAYVCGNATCEANEIYAIVAGSVSFVLCILLLKVDETKFHGSDKGICLFLALWWAVGLAYLTIQGPFRTSDRSMAESRY